MRILKWLILLILLLAGTTAVLAYGFPKQALALLQSAGRAAAGLQERSVEADGITFSYLAGSEGEPLLLLHGFGAEKDHWALSARYLTGHMRVIAPDIPGFGASSSPADADYSVATQVERLHAFAKALNLEHFHLGGNSMGGEIAAAYAARYPEQVLSLWLLAPAGVAGAEPSELVRRVQAGENPLLIEQPGDYQKLVDFVFAEPTLPLSEPMLKVLGERAMEQRPLQRRIFANLVESPPLEPQLQGLQVPTLIVWGTEDRLLDVSGAEILLKVLPQSQLMLLPEVGHVPMLERPEEVTTGYLRFVRNHGIGR